MKQIRKILFLLLITGFSLSLTGCGVKPRELDPPEGTENSNYPKAYPQPSKPSSSVWPETINLIFKE